MATVHVLHIFFSLYVFFITGTDGSYLKITQYTNSQSGATSLTLRCIPTNHNYTVLHSLQINRSTMSPLSSPLTLGAINNSVITTEGRPLRRYTVTGELHGGSPQGDASSMQQDKSYIQVVIHNMQCQETANYKCITNGESGDVDTNMQTYSRNYTVKTYPSNIVISVTPRKDTYKVNETVDFECTGQVGNPQKLWSWQWKYRHTMIWVYVPFTLENNISAGPVEPPSPSQCSFISSSKLRYVIKAADDGRGFRCLVANSQYEYKAETIISVSSRTTSTAPQYTSPSPQYTSPSTITLLGDSTTQPNTQESVSPAGLDSGEIAGIVIGVIVFLVIIIVIIVVIAKKRDGRRCSDVSRTCQLDE